MLKKKSREEPKKQFLFGNSIDYARYDLALSEKALAAAAGFAAGALLGFAFYGLPVAALIGGVVTGIAAVPLYRSYQKNKRLNALKLQFRDLLESVATSIGAGQNVPDAFVSAYADLREQYSEKAYIVQELSNIVAGMNNNITIEALLMDFAERSGIDDIASFANVFETVYRKGGNIKEVIKSTREIISDKMEVEMEIQTMVTSAKTELNMMMVMPVVLVLLLRYMGGAMANLDSPVGYLATTCALVIFAAAYFLGRKIMMIRL